MRVYRGQPIMKDGKPTGKRHPIRSRERFAQKGARAQVQAQLGRPLTKAERKALKKQVNAALAARATA